MDKIKVLITDDHKVVRTGIKILFKGDKDIDVVGEAQNGKEAIEMLEKCSPDVE